MTNLPPPPPPPPPPNTNRVLTYSICLARPEASLKNPSYRVNDFLGGITTHIAYVQVYHPAYDVTIQKIV